MAGIPAIAMLTNSRRDGILFSLLTFLRTRALVERRRELARIQNRLNLPDVTAVVCCEEGENSGESLDRGMD
jgi:hypothetical protein